MQRVGFGVVCFLVFFLVLVFLVFVPISVHFYDINLEEPFTLKFL